MPRDRTDEKRAMAKMCDWMYVTDPRFMGRTGPTTVRLDIMQQDKQRTSCQQIPLLKVRVDKAGYPTEADLKPPLPGGHPHHEPGSPRSAVAAHSSSSAKLKKRPLCRFWKLRFPGSSSSSSSSRSRLVALLVAIATLVLVAVVASLVYTLYTRSKMDLRKEEIRQDPEAGSWAVEVTFRVTNRNYSPDLVDHSSRAFKSLASEVARALDELFYLGPLSQDYNMTQVIEFSASDSSSIGVSCRIVLNQPLTNAAHHVGLAFIQVLEQGHGILPAGNLRVDIRSLHFTNVKPGAVPPPVMVTHGPSYFDAAWSPWSPWSDCMGHDGLCNPNRLRSRRRECRSHYGRGSLLPDNLACLEQGGKEVEFKSCLCPTRAPPHTTTTTGADTASEDGDDDDDGGDSEPESATSATPSTTRKQATADTASQPSMPDDWRPCHQCQPGEICFMSGQETKPHCVTPKDPKDPRGCGGWCSGPNELCRRLDNVTVHCVDDSECLHDEWRCTNGLCIPEQRRCDGHFNCYDMTDEYNCECGSDGFHCSNNTSCLPLDRRCNGFVDCWDGSDEANCTALCPTSQHTCNSGQCIPMDNFCDSYRDCDDGSDEPPGCDSPCLAHQRQCQNGRCVPGSVWCDGFDSCGDGSDEANCGSAAPSRDRSSVVPALPPGHLLGRLLPNTHRKATHPQTPVARSHR